MGLDWGSQYPQDPPLGYAPACEHSTVTDRETCVRAVVRRSIHLYYSLVQTIRIGLVLRGAGRRVELMFVNCKDRYYDYYTRLTASFPGQPG